ncbi:MAG TPA: hypothetical protein PKE40_03550 [Arachnia sp.]|nr:hypothetical protein [Arachnia sp.]HMT85405.1 hypothetical protein [Arachnia sp.]
MPEPALARARLRDELARGKRDEVIEVLLTLTPAQRRALRREVKPLHDAILSAPTGRRAPNGEWEGVLRRAHWSAAAAALIGCSTIAQAVRYHPLDPPDSVDIPKAFFPDQLDAFAEEWSARFRRNPKAWDRIRGLDAMFDWAHEGLIDPPEYDGAVLLLASAARHPFSTGTRLLRYLEARPCLIDTTFARIFDVDGIKGASPAQADFAHLEGERGVGNYVIPQLVKRGHWSRNAVLDGIDRALARDLGAYQHRWWRRLRTHIDKTPSR